MLQVNALKAQQASEIGEQDNGNFYPIDVVRNILKRKWRVILLITAASFAAGVLYCILAVPLFTATASVLIETRKVSIMQQSPIGDSIIDPGMIDSQVEILRSDWIAASVVKRLDLVNDPEFNSPPNFLSFAIASVRNLFAAANEASSPDATFKRAAEKLKSNLNVRRLGQSYLMEISYQSQSPDRAAVISNAIAEVYIADQLTSRVDIAKRAGSWLQDRIKELGQQATKAAEDLLKYKINNNIVESNGRSIVDLQLSELSTQLGNARNAMNDAKARLDRVEDIRRGEVASANIPENIRSDVVTKLRQQYLDLKAREADARRRVGDAHETVVAIRSQAREVNRALQMEYDRLAQAYRGEYEIARTREQATQSSLDSLVSVAQRAGGAEVTMRELEGAAQTARTLYNNFLQRQLESTQQESFPITEARLVSPATRPLLKSYPQTILIVAGATLLGFLVGSSGAFGLELIDGTLKSRGQVESAIGVPCIAIVPETDEAQISWWLRAAVIRLFGMRRPAAPAQQAVTYVLKYPRSLYAEAIREVKVSLILAGLVKTDNVVGVTSSEKAEGKTTIAANLAYVAASMGQKVLLIDADFRNSKLSNLLTPQIKVGLSQVAMGSAQFAAAVRRGQAHLNLDFMPSGVTAEEASMVYFPDPEQVRSLLLSLREQYDLILLDLPPAAPFADVKVAGQIVDGFIYVARWGRTQSHLVRQAINHNALLKSKLVGIVLNRAISSNLQS